MTDAATRFQRLQQRYRDREMPWDHQLPPPEVMATAETLPPGRALDLGCGTARAGVYLAAHGWKVDGVDFVPEAIALAEERVRSEGLTDQIRLFNTAVTALDYLQEPYDLVIDVGCMHAMPDDELREYAAEVTRLTRPGGLYLLFAHLQERVEGETPAWISKGSVEKLFAAGFEPERIEYGTTHVGESSWSSAWFWMRRKIG